MSSSLKLWPITVTNPKTKETIKFLGQGRTVSEAVADGAKNCGDTFRPNQSGQAMKSGDKGGPNRIACYLEDGTFVSKSLREFEEDPEPTPVSLDFA